MHSKLIIASLFLLFAPLLSGCGFTPVYATNGGGDGPPLKGVKLAGVEASETAAPILTRAFLRRTALAGDAVEYDLVVTVKESAQPLAVQIDDSVTRYNYRLEANYTLTKRADGKEIKGKADSVASFNVVSSQYSTLFAEQDAREKAARVLADEVERDILLKFAAARQADAGPAPMR